MTIDILFTKIIVLRTGYLHFVVFEMVVCKTVHTAYKCDENSFDKESTQFIGYRSE